MSYISTKRRGILAVRANGSLPPEVQAVVDRVSGAFDEFKAEHRRRLDEADARMDAIETQGNRLHAGGSVGLVKTGRVDAVNAMLRAHLGDGARRLDSEGVRNYDTAVSAYIRRGERGLTPDILAQMQVGSDPAGGFWVVPDFDPIPVERRWRTSPMRELATVQPINSDHFEGIYDADEFASGGWVGEHDSRTETDTGDIGKFSIYAREIYAMPIVTQKLLDDAVINVETWVMTKLARKLNRVENTAFVSGVGVSQPRGFLDYRTEAVTTADESRAWGKLQYVPIGAAGNFPQWSGISADDPSALVDTIAALHPEYRSEAVWVMNSQTEARVQKLRDADGRFLWRASLDRMQPNTLLGYPVFIMEDMPDIGADAFPIAFGNFREGYMIVEKPGIRMLRDPYTTKGKVKFYTYRRVGGDVVNFDAIKLVKVATS